MTDRYYSEIQRSYIEGLRRDIDGNGVPMAVCDYLGRHDGDGPVDKTSSLNRRFGTRDMRHVQIYKLDVIAINRAAKLKGFDDPGAF